jgi:3-hydroxybutyryl-CoA dehydrogenase
MTGIIIADPDGQDIFRDIFNGTDIRVQWIQSPSELAGAQSDFVLDLSFQPAPGSFQPDSIRLRSDHTRVKALMECKTDLVLIDAVRPTLGELSAGFGEPNGSGAESTAGPRLVRINGWNTFLQRPLAEVAAPAESLPLLENFFTAWSKSFVLVPDTPGMPSARIVAMIVNEAYLTLGEDVSTRESIDTAMKLGTNYPFGPFEWCGLIGTGKILDLLERLAEDNPRYAAAPLLREEAYSLLKV